MDYSLIFFAFCALTTKYTATPTAATASSHNQLVGLAVKLKTDGFTVAVGVGEGSRVAVGEGLGVNVWVGTGVSVGGAGVGVSVGGGVTSKKSRLPG